MDIAEYEFDTVFRGVHHDGTEGTAGLENCKLRDVQFRTLVHEDGDDEREPVWLRVESCDGEYPCCEAIRALVKLSVCEMLGRAIGE